MNYLLLQVFLLLLASYFLGAFVACVLKRAVFGSAVDVSDEALAPVQIDVPVRPPLVVPPQPVHVRAHPIAPRAIDPVQPKIDVLRRPDPRPMPTVLDPSRFERALLGPDPNEGVPRRAIVELRPSVLKPVTGIYVPRPPEPPPMPPEVEPQPEVLPEAETPSLLPEDIVPPKRERTGGLAARLRDATTAAAAGAVAAAKAAAAASVAMPGMLSSRNAPAVAEPEPEESIPREEALERSVQVDVSAPADDGSETWPDPLADAVSASELSPEAEKPAEPEPEIAMPAVAQPSIEGGDDFQRIRAIDDDLERNLKARGVNYFEDIARWTSAEVKQIGQELGIPGRIDREQWVEQAQILAKGGETYYSRNRKSAMKLATSPPSRGDRVVLAPSGAEPQSDLSGVAAASQGRSVAEMAAAAAAAIAAASASVTRGLKPIEPISPLSKVDPKISIPAKITDAIRQNGGTAAETAEVVKEGVQPEAIPDGPRDDLKRIRGIGVLIEKRLNALGVGRYDQIANWTSGDIDRVSRSLEFKGRIERENWVEQARILASGGQTEFSRRVDRGEVDTSRDT